MTTETQTAAQQANPQTGEIAGPRNMLAEEALTRFQELLLQPHDLKPAPPDPFEPKSVDEMWALAEIYAQSDFVPKDYQGKPANCFVAMNWGKEIGLKPLQSLQNIAVINGRPSLWGDAQLALVRSSPHCEYVLESMDDKGTAICRAKRRNEAEQVREFSIEDAKTAGLVGKQGPHTQYPKRMRQLRARAFALRDVFTDVLRGIPQTEELLSIAPPADVTPASLPRNATPAQIATAAAPKASADVDVIALQDRLMKIAAEQGTKAFKKAWNALSEDERVAIGIPERDRLLEVGERTDNQKTQKAEPAAEGGQP
jgi:hypothetical protein